MTEFRKHDRLRVVNGKRRGVDGLTLEKGQIVTVASVKDDSVVLEGVEDWWFSNRFELVEHAVNTDKDGKPLYVGDIVRRRAYPQDTVEGLVKNPQPVNGNVFFFATNRSMDLAPPRHLVELVRHHWETPIALGFDGTTADHPFVVIGYMDDGGAMKIHPPRMTAEQARRWAHEHWGFSNHALGSAVDVPVQLNWDDVVIGSVVQVRVRTTGEEFTAEVTESPNGTKKSQEPSPHVHGLWTGSSIVRKHWELLRHDLPVKSWVDGSIIRLTNEATGRPELHRIGGSWIAAKSRKIWRDAEVANYSYEIIRDTQKEN